MTEINFGMDWMIPEYPKVRRQVRSSVGKLMPISSSEVLNNYLRELESIERKIENDKIVTQTKMRRVLLRREKLLKELIPKAKNMITPLIPL